MLFYDTKKVLINVKAHQDSTFLMMLETVCDLDVFCVCLIHNIGVFL